MSPDSTQRDDWAYERALVDSAADLEGALLGGARDAFEGGALLDPGEPALPDESSTTGPDGAPDQGPVRRATPRSASDIATLLGRPGPTPEQQRVIEAPLEPMLVVAGAGSGKTETMAARVVWLIDNGFVAPEQVLGLTFTRKAAGELAERVQARLAQLARAEGRPGGLAMLDRPTIATYNAYAGSLVTDHALRLGVEPDSRLLSEASQWQLAAGIVESWTGDFTDDPSFSTVVQAVLTLSGALGEHLLEPDEAAAGVGAIVDRIVTMPLGEKRTAHYADVLKLVRSLDDRRRVLELVGQYREAKRRAEALDFGDQIEIAARLAREVPQVAAAERARFRVVLLDEYQDTSYAQTELLAALFGGGHAVTAVGDPHQSIYGWRGASASGLARFPERFAPAGGSRAPVHYLSTSWRNDHAVLDAANVVAAPLRAIADAGPRAAVEVPPLAARPGAGDGAVTSVYAATIEEEAAAVADFVAARWRPARSADGAGRVSAAVLCRARSQFVPIEVALRAKGLPVEVVGLGGLLSTPEVVDVVALLEAAHDPSRGDSLARILTGPRVGLGPADLHALASRSADLARFDSPARARRERAEVDLGADGDVVQGDVVQGDVVDHRSIVDALDDLPRPGQAAFDGRTLSPAAHARLTALAGTLRVLRTQTYLSLPELVAQAEHALGLDIEVALAAEASRLTSRTVGSGDRGRAHLDAFRDVAATFAQTADTPTLGAFLAWLGTAASQERGLDLPLRAPDPDAVQVITVHASKGLEWDVVAVPGLVDGVFPSVRTQGSDGPKDSGWLTGLGELPYALRGDAADLPALDVDAVSDGKALNERLVAFRHDAGAHQLLEERRLAYVALTRARRDLLVAGAWWRSGTKPVPPSPFLVELAEAGVVDARGWAGLPEGDNPRDADVEAPTWPVTVDDVDVTSDGDVDGDSVDRDDADRDDRDDTDRDGVHGDGAAHDGSDRDGTGVVAHLRATADRVVRAAAEGTPPEEGTGLRDESGADLVQLARLLLTERDRRHAEADVAMPAHLSASALVRLAADRDAFTLQLRRPVPQRPTPHARQGTAFHLWAEQYFTSSSLLDPWDVPGADDEPGGAADLEALKQTFLDSPWARRTPVAVEVDVETPLAGVMLRSRIDAVFPEDPDDADGATDAVVVVDWKTGRVPRDAESRRTREVQLAVYRLAWARWTGLPVEKVRAAFYYVADDETVRPAALLDEAGLEALVLGG
ncbi:DNA helicase-2/ATP-dependent DNA helicase PcrA [Sediminihabitans luteus]|uniref:DNA 3'-5' helicase n=1 Tax=Sediminihabitans luteus TaxID=1138585 RepID=A0A2M9CYT3_9CELL|nr:ATP-dependent DNA helicase [Sediminihabitans luteus]PJJ77102.1 DNA helicase-2/ATP-dependent DNA helicase PcrA [Sediminihabitans luteus]GIJ00379.1 hypothetical protein Slu03_27560 [Sediminihabitans luteus]